MQSKEWGGNSKSKWVALAAKGHSDVVREEWDFYATPEKAVTALFDETGISFSENMLEPCAGLGHISEVAKRYVSNVVSKDIIQREYPLDGTWDFLEQNETFDGDVIMNPPYKYCLEFVEKALEMIPENNKVYAFLKIQFLESNKRRGFFDKGYLSDVYVFTNRVTCAMNGEFEKYKSSAVCYGWFVFSKSNNHKPNISWIN